MKPTALIETVQWWLLQELGGEGNREVVFKWGRVSVLQEKEFWRLAAQRCECA